MAEKREVINSQNSSTQATYSRDGDIYNVDGQQIDSYTNQLLDLEKELPANNGSDSLVHWLGSSYSGADIKIIVHMYDELNLAEEKTLADDLEFFNELHDAFIDIEGNADYYSEIDTREQREAFYTMWEGKDSRVLGHVVQFINTFNSVPRTTRASVIRSAAQANRDEYFMMIEATRQKLENIDGIKEDQYSTFTLATAQTFSIQTHREKAPVRALGHSNVKGFVRGQRTIAGSIIFTMFNEHALASLIRKMGASKNKFDPSAVADEQISSLLIDQLPPIDITIVFANEYGSLSRGAVYGVEFMNSGITLSIEDILTEEVVNFVARDADPIISAGRVGIDRKQRGMHFNQDGSPSTGSDLLFASKSAYDSYLGKLKVRRNFRNR